jgi:hypothetical protein
MRSTGLVEINGLRPLPLGQRKSPLARCCPASRLGRLASRSLARTSRAPAGSLTLTAPNALGGLAPQGMGPSAAIVTTSPRDFAACGTKWGGFDYPTAVQQTQVKNNVVLEILD